MVFDKDLYPGYENKKVNEKGSFPIFDAKTYIFSTKDEIEEPEEVQIEGEEKIESMENMINIKKDLNNHSLLS